MARGGPRKPNPRTPPSGPGQYSRRTDGQQVATPGLASDLQYGDVGMLEASQAANPLPAGVLPPRGGPPAIGAPPRGRTEGGVPPYLLQMDSRRPLEPTQTGLPSGPGLGPEALSQPPPMTTEEATLTMLVREFGDQAAQGMLDRIHREQMAQRSQLVPPTVPGPGAPTMSEVGLDYSATPPPKPGPAGPENVPPKGA